MPISFNEAKRQIIEYLNDPTHAPDGHLAQVMPQVYSLIMAGNFVYDHRGSNLVHSDEVQNEKLKSDALAHFMKAKVALDQRVEHLKMELKTTVDHVDQIYKRADEILSGE